MSEPAPLSSRMERERSSPPPRRDSPTPPLPVSYQRSQQDQNFKVHRVSRPEVRSCSTVIGALLLVVVREVPVDREVEKLVEVPIESFVDKAPQRTTHSHSTDREVHDGHRLEESDGGVPRTCDARALTRNNRRSRRDCAPRAVRYREADPAHGLRQVVTREVPVDRIVEKVGGNFHQQHSLCIALASCANYYENSPRCSESPGGALASRPLTVPAGSVRTPRPSLFRLEIRVRAQERLVPVEKLVPVDRYVPVEVPVERAVEKARRPCPPPLPSALALGSCPQPVPSDTVTRARASLASPACAQPSLSALASRPCRFPCPHTECRSLLLRESARGPCATELLVPSGP